MRRAFSSAFIAAALLAAALSSGARAAQSGLAAQQAPNVGRSQTVEGFTVTPRWVVRAHEAGAADYVAARHKVFIFVYVEVKRQGGHASYLADPQDFHLQTSDGAVIDSEPFGVGKELQAKHVYTKVVAGVIGFEAPATDRHLQLLWQPNFDSNPDAQAVWSLGTSGKTVQYYQ